MVLRWHISHVRASDWLKHPYYQYLTAVQDLEERSSMDNRDKSRIQQLFVDHLWIVFQTVAQQLGG